MEIGYFAAAGSADCSATVLALSACEGASAPHEVVPPPAAIAGAATVVAQLGTNTGKVISGTPPSSSVANMIAAAQAYSQVNQNILPSDVYYAGLWNAVGFGNRP